MRHPQLGRHIQINPALLALPKAPRSYQTESAKSWTDDELQKLIAVMRKKAEVGETVGKRDSALLLLYMATGMRREEVISLRGKDVLVDKTLVITGKIKGGNCWGRKVDDNNECFTEKITFCGRVPHRTPSAEQSAAAHNYQVTCESLVNQLTSLCTRGKTARMNGVTTR